MFYLFPEQAVYQGVSRTTKFLAPSEFCEAEVIDRLGVAPIQVADYKALCGDESDNIPGVKGIGPKTAAKLLNSYGSLDNIYASLGNIKGAVKDRLAASQPSAYFSQRLARLRTDAPISVRLEDCLMSKCRFPVPHAAFTSIGDDEEGLWNDDNTGGYLAWRRVPESECGKRAALLSAELGVHDSCAVGWVAPAIVNLLSCFAPS